MPIVIGLFLIPVVIGIIYTLNLITTPKKTRIKLHITLVALAIGFIVLCLIMNAEPFKFEIHYSVMYMLYRAEYFISVAIIFLFTPFLWIIVVF